MKIVHDFPAYNAEVKKSKSLTKYLDEVQVVFTGRYEDSQKRLALDYLLRDLEKTKLKDIPLETPFTEVCSLLPKLCTSQQMICKKQQGIWAFEMHSRQSYYAYVAALKQYCDNASDLSEDIQQPNHLVVLCLMTKRCEIESGLRQHLISDPSKHGTSLFADLLQFIADNYGEEKKPTALQ